MNSKIGTCIWLVLAVASVTLLLRAQFDAYFIEFSSFQVDAEGWTAVDREPGTGAYLRVHSTPDQLIVGRGGFIQASPGDGDLYFRAPARFVGDKSTAFGGTLEYYAGGSGQSVGSNYPWDVLLSDGATTLYTQTQRDPPDLEWQNFVWKYRYVFLVESGWTNLATGAPATRQQMISVLSSLVVMDIRGGYGTQAAETNALTGVLLTAGCPFATIRKSGADEVEISWRSQLDWFYRVEYRSSLVEGAWIRISDIMIGTGGEMSVHDTIARGQPQRFYRVCTLQ